jgi:4-diphosphocytidyl-2-C-methyl-D-erythritol kinase
MNSIEIKANAKINLALVVKYKREDGYHEIELIYQEIDFHDRLILKKATGIEFSTDSEDLQNESSNLCITAARLLIDAFDLPGMKIHLEKKIPIGSGLGGGSSNAAAVLKGGLELYRRETSDKRVQSLAEKIGSDVPFFLEGGTAYGTGKGEILKKVHLTADYHVLLILPDIKISTLWAYKNLNLALTRKKHDYKFKGFTIQNLDLSHFRSEFYNDFENLVFKHHPQLAIVKSELYDLEADFVSLSGSGSAMYGLFSSLSKAEEASDVLNHRFNAQICRPVIKM